MLNKKHMRIKARRPANALQLQQAVQAYDRPQHQEKELSEMSDVSATSIAKLGKGGNVNTGVLLRICNALNCDVGDIMEFVPDKKQSR